MKRMNLGCGYVTPEDWTNVDISPYNSSIVFADVLDRLPYDDETFDFVLMNCVLQVFTYNEHETVLKEVRRVMKPKATLRILTPDLSRAASRFCEGGPDFDYHISDELEKTWGGKFARYLFWHGESRCAFNDEALIDLLDRNGYQDVERGIFGECELDSREDEVLIVTGVK